jgi:phospholipase C
MPSNMENIEHIVVLMMENRSFDNLLGWLAKNPTTSPWPAVNIPAKTPPTFDGLLPNAYSNTDKNGATVFATEGTHPWPPYRPAPQTGHYPPPIPDNDALTVPNPDPNEAYDSVTNQIFGIPPGRDPDMSGFLQDYATANPVSPNQIMEAYAPSQASVINNLAMNFAVCDRWFAPVPSETWPNRGFMHAGSSAGYVNNHLISPYDIDTIFNILSNQDKTWGVFSDSTIVPSLVSVQFHNSLRPYPGNFRHFSAFQQCCQAASTAAPGAKLPAYSFVEPVLLAQGDGDLFENDYHPPSSIKAGEYFLAQVYECLRTSPYRDKILFVVLFDEHGGCYDHVPPPSGAAPPAPGPIGTNGFKFDRFGVRVPAIVVSSYVQAGTVFRAPEGATPYDHTSVLATLRDWLAMDKDPAHPFLPSPRIQAAPTLDAVLAASVPRDWPQLTGPAIEDIPPLPGTTPINDVQRGLLAAVAQQRVSGAVTHADAMKLVQAPTP